MRDSALHNWLNKKRGNQTKLADGLGITLGAITQWRQVPIERVLDVARITRISRTKLRPDVYRPAKRKRNGSIAARQ